MWILQMPNAFSPGLCDDPSITENLTPTSQYVGAVAASRPLVREAPERWIWPPKLISLPLRALSG